MGIYWNNFIFYGVIINSEQYKTLLETSQYKEHMDAYQTYLSRCGDRYLLCVPQTYFNLKNVYAMFEEHEIKQGFVAIDDIKLCLRKRLLTEDQINEIFNPPADEKYILEEFINLLGDQSQKADFKMAQCCWTSLSFPDSSLEKSLAESVSACPDDKKGSKGGQCPPPEDDSQVEHILGIKFRDVKTGETYQHYKNHKLYQIIGTGRHTETLEEFVVYKALYLDETFGNEAIWVRPKKMFLEDVSDEGGIVHRFTRGDESPIFSK